jgi:hypothetical protein
VDVLALGHFHSRAATRAMGASGPIKLQAKGTV